MKKCPSCGSEVEKGVLLDFGYGAVVAQRYAKADIPDTPQTSKLKTYESDFADERRIVAYRCLKCNRVELYAQQSILLSKVNSSAWKVLILIAIMFVVAFLIVLMLYPYIR